MELNQPSEPSFPSLLRNLGDVDPAALADRYAPVYNAASDKFEMQEVGGGGEVSSSKWHPNKQSVDTGETLHIQSGYELIVTGSLTVGGTLTVDGLLYVLSDVTVPAGGTTGQALVKNTDTDYDYQWQSITGNLPSGTQYQTITHNGTDWVTNDVLRIEEGTYNSLFINSDPSTPFDGLACLHIEPFSSVQNVACIACKIGDHKTGIRITNSNDGTEIFKVWISNSSVPTVIIGNSDAVVDITCEKIRFFDSGTHVAQPASADQAAITTDMSGNSNDNELKTLVNALRDALVSLGLIKGSA